MIELILVRHGETEANSEPTALGSTDLALSDRGRMQALSLARLFKTEKIDALYASPLLRTMETAEILGEKHELFIEPVLDLCERDFGIWETLPVRVIRERYPEDYAAWQQDKAGYKIPEGESAYEAYLRNTAAIESILKRHEAGKIVVVTHLGCIRNILAHLLGLGILGSWQFDAKNGRVCRLQIDEAKNVLLTSLNEF